MENPARIRRMTWVVPQETEPIHIRRRWLMTNNTMVVGLDVHKKTIAVAVLYAGSDLVNERQMIENTPENVEKLVRHLAAQGKPVFCYEAGPCGYTLQRQITQ